MGDVDERLRVVEARAASFTELEERGIQASLDYIQINVAPQIVNLQQSITLAQNQIDQIIIGGKAPDALKFGGQLPAYYATASALADGLAGKVPSARKVNGKELSDDVILAKSDVGLGNADNTSDKDKPVSDLQRAAIDAVAQSASTKASRRNRHLNPAFQVCQDRAAGATIDVASALYVFDGVFLNSTGGGVLRAGQALAVTPGGSGTRFRSWVVTADSAYGTGDYYGVAFNIEGHDVADLKFGTEGARPFTWRGVVNLPQGTYGLSFTNNQSASMSYVKMFTVTAAEANKDKLVTAVVPGCATGTWIKDNTGVGLSARITFASGSNFITNQEGQWINGNFVGTAAQSPGVGTVGNVFEVADIGLYEGNNLPEWELPDAKAVYRDCLRYFENGEATFNAYVPGPNWTYGVNIAFAEKKRVVPNMSSIVLEGSFSGVDPKTFESFYHYMQSNGGNNYSRIYWTANARL
ncbi:hypothetical protein [Rhizobium sp. ZX09]|uniref:hypothetical protein n=1 Tax=Rhizobium sp. ZX09 TaxID=2291939 RepID=UPI001A994E05|nr:hypothetical protein [Rhizobium sp. ZX09]